MQTNKYIRALFVCFLILTTLNIAPQDVPVVLTESRDEITLLMLRIEKEHRPMQVVLLIQEDLSSRGLVGAETIQAQLGYCSQRLFVIILSI